MKDKNEMEKDLQFCKEYIEKTQKTIKNLESRIELAKKAIKIIEILKIKNEKIKNWN